MPDESPPEHYVWQPPGKPFTILLAFDVIDRLNVDIMRGFGAVRRRGIEVGGLLLGRIELAGTHVTVTIDDYEPVPCEYAFGPSYVLSPHDLHKLGKSLAYFDPSAGSDLYTVGFYRSHTRDGLTLDEHDLQFFREYFQDPLHVAMLVRPYATRAGVGGFFAKENELMNTVCPLEFPFRSKELTGDAEQPPHAAAEPGPSERIRRMPVEPREPVAQAAAHRPPPPPPMWPAAVVQDAPGASPDYGTKPFFSLYETEPSKTRLRAGWMLFIVMLVVFGVAVGYQYSGTPAHNTPASSTADPYALDLTATRVDDNLVVKWDRQSLAVKGGWRGLLTITEGTDSKAVQMDVPQLQNGTVLYRHVAPEVQFKLEVFLKEQRSVVETFLWHMN